MKTFCKLKCKYQNYHVILLSANLFFSISTFFMTIWVKLVAFRRWKISEYEPSKLLRSNSSEASDYVEEITIIAQV